jgi:class 3 adenylate cyclase
MPSSDGDPKDARPRPAEASRGPALERLKGRVLSRFDDYHDPRRYLAGAVLDGYTKFLHFHNRRVGRKAVARLCEHLEDLAAKIRATCGWLFVPDRDNEPRRLVAIATFRAPPCRLPLDRESIVGHVFKMRTSYATGDTRDDPYFVEVVPGVRSAVSIPVWADYGDGAKVIAVLHYECLDPNAFGDPERQELERLAGLLVLPLLVWRRARRPKPDTAVFDPCSDGWGLEPLYRQLLKFLVRALDQQGKAGRPALALWTYDRQKDQRLPRPGSDKVTVMFTDMAGSTEFAEVHGSRALYEKRRQHNQLLVPLIESNQGTLVQIVGDALLGIFLDPGDAVRSAVAMQRRLAEYNATEPEMEDQQIHIRIGIHKGKAFVFREGDRVEFVGRAINTASRVEQGDRKRTDQILLSEQTVAGLGNAFPIEFLREFKAKGIGRLKLYRLLWKQVLG